MRISPDFSHPFRMMKFATVAVFLHVTNVRAAFNEGFGNQYDSSNQDQLNKGDTGASPSFGDCFPSDAQVELEGGFFVTMSKLQVGDVVRVGPAEFSPVYTFSHKDPSIQSEFVKIVAAGKTLRLTPGHYIYVNSKLQTARTVKVGDAVSAGKVTDVSTEAATGLYSPHTHHGDIYVEGIKASSYTDAVTPSLAHSLLWPFRMLSTHAGVHIDTLDPESTAGRAFLFVASNLALTGSDK